MNILIISLFFILGLIIGSFLNVVSRRYNTGRTLLGRSICFNCSKKLSWYELIPVFSFLFQMGKCRSCRSNISWQYFLVETLTGILFALIAWQNIYLLYFNPIFFGLIFVLLAFIFSTLVVILSYDIRHMIIPDKMVYLFIFFSFVFIFINPNNLFLTQGNFFLNFVLSLLPAFILFCLWFFSGGVFVGFGDVKLMVGIGFLLGFSKVMASFLISFWIGALFSLFLIVLKKNKFSIKSEIPFAPFLVLGAVVTFFSNIDLFSILSIFSIWIN